MSLVENLEIDIMDYKGEKCFQVLAEYINESIILFENTISKVNSNDIRDINQWVGHVMSENRYQDIDNLFSNNATTIEEKLKSKKTISENLKKSPSKVKEVIGVPLKSMVEVANKTIKTYLNDLTFSVTNIYNLYYHLSLTLLFLDKYN